MGHGVYQMTVKTPTVRVERLIAATIDDVFTAWTNPVAMARWLAPSGTAEVEADVRVGGSFRVVMIDDQSRIEHTGEYLDIVPPRRLSFTWNSPYTGPLPSIVTVTLTPEGDGTRVVLSHEGLPADTAPGHQDGWDTIVQRLTDLLVVEQRS